MHILIKTICGKIISLDVEPADTIVTVKGKIYNKEGIPPYQQRLYFSDSYLNDDDPLCYCRIIK